MKSLLWLLVGLAGGFVIAHQVNRTAEGREFFEGLDRKARDFSQAVQDGYHTREAELRQAVDDAGATISELSKD